MLLVLHVAATFLVSIGWALALAHALELPGKRRLDKDHYVAVQAIYYPGFTIGGVFGEFGAILATILLLLATPRVGPEFGLTLAALLSLLAMHATYWILTHPTNKFWIRDQQMGELGADFFGAGRRGRELARADPEQVWKSLRDRWELSHVVRALFAGAALLCLIVAAAV